MYYLFNTHPLIFLNRHKLSQLSCGCPAQMSFALVPSLCMLTLASKHQHLDFFAEGFICPQDKINGASQMVLVVKNLLANPGDIRNAESIPGSGRSPGGGHGNPLQYSPVLLGESHGQRSLQATEYVVTESNMTESTWHRTKILQS